MFQLLVQMKLIWASHEGNWHLHLTCFPQMLPWFIAYGNVNYACYGSYYLASMNALPSSTWSTHQWSFWSPRELPKDVSVASTGVWLMDMYRSQKAIKCLARQIFRSSKIPPDYHTVKRPSHIKGQGLLNRTDTDIYF